MLMEMVKGEMAVRFQKGLLLGLRIFDLATHLLNARAGDEVSGVSLFVWR
jgi:hypothetical protein